MAVLKPSSFSSVTDSDLVVTQNIRTEVIQVNIQPNSCLLLFPIYFLKFSIIILSIILSFQIPH